MGGEDDVDGKSGDRYYISVGLVPIEEHCFKKEKHFVIARKVDFL